jgi:hypothetical protein
MAQTQTVHIIFKTHLDIGFTDLVHDYHLYEQSTIRHPFPQFVSLHHMNHGN